MPDVSAGSISVDIQPYLDQLALAEKSANQLADAARTVGDNTTKSFAAAAASQVQFSEKVAAGRAELAGIAAAARDTQGEIRKLIDRGKELEQAVKKASGADESKKWTAELEKNNTRIKEAKFSLEELKKATDQERTAINAVVDARRKEVGETKLAAAAAKDTAAAAKQQASATDSAGKSTGALTGLLEKGLAAGAAFFAIDKVLQFKDEVQEAVVNVERLRARLTTAFDGDSSKANAAIAQLADFADLAGQDVDALGDSYANLVNRGITPTKTQLRQLADIAAVSGKSIDQFAEALVDSIAGQNDRLAEFGITARQSGDKVAFTFRGISTEVAKTREAIAGYLFGLGDLQGVQGAAIAQAQETAGENTRLSNSFTELFRVIGERSGPAFSLFARGLRAVTQGITESLKSNEQKAIELAAKQADSFATAAEKRLAAVAARAKANGEDITKAVEKSYIQTALADGKAVADAEKALRDFNSRPEPSLGSREGGSDIAVRRIQAESRALENQLEVAKARQRVNEDAFRKSQAAGKEEESQLGRIEALRELIAANTKKRDAAKDTVEGNKERVRLNALLKEENTLLDLLLGKEARRRKAQQLSYEAQLRALLAERATLAGLAARAAVTTADTAALAARASFEDALRQVDAVKAKLEERERDLAKQARRVGGSRAVAGLGEKADGQVDGVQAQQLTQLRLAALDTYYAALFKITAEREQRLFDLQAESNEREIETVDRKYARLIRADTDGIERQAIEAARQREQLALRAAQEQRRIEQMAALGRSQASAVGEVFGAGTGVSVFEAKRAEAQALLDIEKKAAEDSLNNTLNKVGKEAEIERAALRAQLARIANQQKELTAEQKRSEFSIYKLVLGENDSPELRAAMDEVASSVLNSLSQITQAQQQAAASQASTATQNINELQSALNAEIQLNKEGSASNIRGLQEQIAEQKRVRREALADQRKAAQEQVVIDTLTQASSIATAAANVFAAFSAIPFVGVPLGIGAAGLLVAAFVASKARAFQAASQIGASFFKGGFTGEGDPHEESQALGKKPYTYHKGEFVFDHQKTADLRAALFEPLHRDRPQEIDWSHPKLAALLPDHSLPQQLRQEKAEAHRIQVEHSFAPMQSNFDKMDTRLQAIEQSNQRMADKRDTHALPDGTVLFVDPETGSIRSVS